MDSTDGRVSRKQNLSPLAGIARTTGVLAAPTLLVSDFRLLKRTTQPTLVKLLVEGAERFPRATEKRWCHGGVSRGCEKKVEIGGPCMSVHFANSQGPTLLQTCRHR
jgi:hypothetical protein